MPAGSPADPAQEQRQLQIISGGMLAGVLASLAVALFMRESVASDGLSILSIVASVVAVLSPVLAARASELGPSSGRPGALPDPTLQNRAATVRARHIVAYGILEGAALFCVIAFLVSRPWWPLLALAVPLGSMVLRFPRGPSESARR